MTLDLQLCIFMTERIVLERREGKSTCFACHSELVKFRKKISQSSGLGGV